MASDAPHPPPSGVSKAVDAVFGAVVMGTVGALIGLFMGHDTLPVAAALGTVLGTVVGLLGGRRFLISILVGTVLGGWLAWVLAGRENISIGAVTGAAMGGFLGIQISMLLDMRAEGRRQRASGEAARLSGEDDRPKEADSARSGKLGL